MSNDENGNGKPSVGPQFEGVASSGSSDARETADITNAIIAGIGSNDNANDQMLEIVLLLDHAGYEIIKKQRRAPN